MLFSKIEKKDFDVISPYFSLKITARSYRKNLELIKSGFLFGHSKNKISNFKATQIQDWLKLDAEMPSVQWHFHTLGRGCGVLLARYSEFEEAREILFNVISLWAEANSISNNFENSEQAWAGHTVALRLDFLTAAFLILSEEQKDVISEIILNHIQFLMLDENYDGNWNHGLDQSIALLKASYVFNREKSYKKSLKRILDNFYYSFDEQGVNNEQAIMYHNYNIERFTYANKLISFFGTDVSSFEVVLNKSREFLLHALDPNGYYSILGDTIFTKPLFEHGSQNVHWLASSGENGKKPSCNSKSVYSSGYVFGRSSWSIGDNPSYYSLRFGSARIVHGHNDHTSFTYFSNKNTVISDGGFNGYGADQFRAFFRSPQAHNVVLCPGEEKFLWDAPTELIYCNQADGFDVYALVDHPYLDTKRIRIILFDLINDIFLVHDKIIANASKEFAQNWNFSPLASVELLSNQTLINIEGNKYNLYTDDESKVEVYKGFRKIDSGRLSIIGGFTGVGHNHKVESYSLRSYKSGKNITWKAFFCQYKHDVKRLGDGVFLLDGNTSYSIEYKNERYYVKKQKFGQDLGFMINFSNITYSQHYKEDGIGIYVSNDGEVKEFFTIDLKNISELVAGEVLIDVKVDLIKGEAPTYYYFSTDRNKRRFGSCYIVKDFNKGLLVKIPINPKTDLKVELVCKESIQADFSCFSLEGACQ